MFRTPHPRQIMTSTGNPDRVPQCNKIIGLNDEMIDRKDAEMLPKTKSLTFATYFDDQAECLLDIPKNMTTELVRKGGGLRF